MTRELLDLTPDAFAEAMRASGQQRLWIRRGRTGAPPQISDPRFHELADFFFDDNRDYDDHEAVFLAVGEESRALFGVFIHDTTRGQAQGGVRHWRYENLEHFLRDGLRLAVGMGRKCALADLWWGGGKGIIASPQSASGEALDRECLYREFAEFVTSLRGAYVTAEDAGTTPADMAVIHRHTRFATCIPREVGGSGNPSEMTALGVIRAMEAALDHRSLGGLEGKRIAMQGAGNVGSHMIENLFARGADSVVVSELCEDRCGALRDCYPRHFLEVRNVMAGDASILSEPCDLLCPNALGSVLGPKTIDQIQTKIVCGAANNALLDEVRDARHLADRGITYVPDYVANRMGIVACSNEHAGSLRTDPLAMRHMDGPGGFENSIYNVVRRILTQADVDGVPTTVAAEEIAQECARIPHPIWAERARAIVEDLVGTGWANEARPYTR